MKNSNKSISVQCLLHNACNLSCKFCFETKERGIRENIPININYIKQLPEEIVRVIAPIMKANNTKAFVADIMGGELFSDNIHDDMFDVYSEFLYNLESKLKVEIPDVKFTYFFFSNGVFTNHKRVIKFLKEFDSRITLSYDPMDRFSNDSLKEIWYDTFQHFKAAGFHIAIATLLTKRNINAYIDRDETFEKIGSDICIDNIEYAPRLDYHDYLPNDDDLFRYYKWALDNEKFNISHVNDILEHVSSCDPGSSYMFGECFSEKGKYIHECIEDTPLDKEYYYGKYVDQITPNTKHSLIKNIGLGKRGCLICEYYQQCPSMCWKNILFDKYEMTTCPIQRIYKYLESNPEIAINYDKWRKCYGKSWREFYRM